MANIHATAVIDSKASLGKDVEIGPYCIVEGDVTLEDGVVLRSHVVVGGNTRVGAETEIYPFASIGLAPQDLKYAGENSELIIGCRNRIREYVTMNPGTTNGGMVTRVGDDCLFMTGSHVAHDCIVGDHVILANNATLGGHVTIEEGAIIGGLSAVHQFVRIGRHAMVGGMSGVEHDVIPYGMAIGERARMQGLNMIGLKRHGFNRADIRAMSEAYAILFGRDDTLAERVERVAREFGGTAGVSEIVDFVRAESARALCQPRAENGG